MDLLGFISLILPGGGGDIMDSNSDNILIVSWFDPIDIDGDDCDFADGDIIVDIAIAIVDATGNCSTRSMALWSKIRTLVAGNRASIGAQGLLIGGALVLFEFRLVGSMLLVSTLTFMPASVLTSVIAANEQEGKNGSMRVANDILQKSVRMDRLL